MKKFLYLLLGLLLLLTTIVLIKTFTFSSKQISVTPVAAFPVDSSTVQRLSKAITFKTISMTDSSGSDSTAFIQFRQFLETNFPLLHKNLQRQLIGGYTLLYTWKGRDINKRPILLMAHQDVVPIESHQWEHPPFSGDIEDGFVWGRGTIDVKTGILGILEATEKLLKENFQPERTIYFAFGHDEEIGGQNGNKKIARLFKKKNIRLEFVLDEGGLITQNVMKDIDDPLALIGIAEKGYLTLELSVRDEGGHASMPPKETAVTILSEAIAKLNNNPFPPAIQGVTSEMFDYVGPEMPFFKKMVFANRWLTKPLIINKMEESGSTNASIRTTMAATVFHAGTKENVLPASAKAFLNFRILPGQTRATVIGKVAEIIDDPRVKIKPGDFGDEPSPISEVNSESFNTIHKTVKQVFPDVVVAPFLVIAATDSRHYKEVTKNIYRFFPARLDKEDLKRFHGANERIGVENYKEIIRFYFQLMKNSASD